MKNPNILKAINLTNITANLVFLMIFILVLSLNAYAGLALIALISLGFPVVVILAVAALIYNIIVVSQSRIGGTLNMTLAIVSGIMSILWLLGFGYYMSNIGI